MQASSPPDFFATGYYDGPQHNIGMFDFKVGYEVQLEIIAPDYGRFHLNFIDDTNKNIVLHVDFRYIWRDHWNEIVFDTYQLIKETAGDQRYFHPLRDLTLHLVSTL